MQGSGAARATECFISAERNASAPSLVCFGHEGKIKPAAGDDCKPPARGEGSPDPQVPAQPSGDFRERKHTGADRAKGHRLAVREPEKFSKGIVDAAGRVIEVRVHHVHVQAPGKDLPHQGGGGPGKRGERRPDRRVVDDEHVSAGCDCLPDHRRCRIQRAADSSQSPVFLPPQALSFRHRTLRQGRGGKCFHLFCKGTHVHIQKYRWAGIYTVYYFG